METNRNQLKTKKKKTVTKIKSNVVNKYLNSKHLHLSTNNFNLVKVVNFRQVHSLLLKIYIYILAQKS